MRILYLGAFLAATLASFGGAQTPPAPDPRPDAVRKLAAEFDAETARYQAAQKALLASPAYRQAAESRDNEKLTALRKEIAPVDRDAFADRAMKIAGELKGDDRARALIYALEIFPSAARQNAALDPLLAEFAGEPILLEFCTSTAFTFVTRADPAAADARLERIVSATKTPLVRAHALYAQSTRLAGAKDATDDAKAKAAELAAEAETLAKGTLLADRIAGPRFEKERLQIGMTAPDIEGVDLEGKTFKLSDYLGRVVVLDFWGDW
jgi:hypothetical protein